MDSGAKPSLHGDESRLELVLEVLPAGGDGAPPTEQNESSEIT